VSEARLPKQSSSPLPRRNVLRGAGILAGATTIGADAAVAQTSTPTPSRNPDNWVPIEGTLRKGMIGFILAHEQFVVPELLKMGEHASRAGFRCLPRAIISNRGRQTKPIPAKAWVTLGALGNQAPNVWMGTSVTCPTMRYNPAVVRRSLRNSQSHLSWADFPRCRIG